MSADHSTYTIPENSYDQTRIGLQRIQATADAVKHLDIELGMSHDCGLHKHTVCNLMFAIERDITYLFELLDTAARERS